ncbi:hypothetical protein CPB83DRAFT_855692 [Crepidotus variabilis]|uniref:Uncharacterized protein n=1 Tax=Crepidotus variabilis TaxID=179855 RepID=A0A9P6EF88_9AGAR|nr:hypothetical protein CPB83DRAFT_855692 [Crepidotus variabilis]
MVFEDNEHYGIHAVDEWETLTPSGHGWVVLGAERRAYAVSMYHQLHCLDGMRYDLTQSKIGKQPTKQILGHANHCYNYLRQELLCHSDLTLERAGANVTGSKVSHVCRDWVQIRDYMEKNHRENVDYLSSLQS